MKKLVSAIFVAACSIMLMGCQPVFGESSSAAHVGRVNAADLDLSNYFRVRLEAGRNHLLRQRPAQAVNAFRQASHDPALAGEAFNGIGVAYARLGRPDVARRYFGLAISANPQEGRYQRNLARLESAGVLRALASRSARDSRSSGSASLSEPPNAVGGAEAVTPAGRAGATQAVLVRTSRYETRLTSRRQSGGLADAWFQREFHVGSAKSGRGVRVAGNPMAIARVGQRAAPPLAHRERITRSERLR